MKRTLISLIVAGLFAVAGTSAMAQNVTADDQKAAADANKPVPAATVAKPTDTPKVEADAAKPAKADAAASKAELTAAKAKAASDYKDAKIKCDSLKGEAMRTCASNANAARDDALAMAETQWKSQQ